MRARSGSATINPRLARRPRSALGARGAARRSVGAVLALALAGCGSLPATAPAASLTRDAAAGGRAPRLGVNIDPDALADEAAFEAALGELHQLGIDQVRMPLRWSEIEPQQGRLDWAGLDARLDALERAQMEVLLSLVSAPAWARHDPPPPAYYWLCDETEVSASDLAEAAPPSDAADLARFAQRLVARYPVRLGAIEVWREPNVLPGWRAAGPDPEDYGRLLTEVAGALRATDPALTIVSASLAPVRIEASPVCYMSDLVFLERLARSGALDQVDAVGFSALGFDDAPSAAASEDRLNARRIELASAVLARNRIDRPIWGLAWGWSSQAREPFGEPGSVGRDPNDGRSADRLRQGWSMALRDWTWVPRLYLWQWQASEPTGASGPAHALRDAAGEPTALWPAFLDIAAGRVPAAPPEPDSNRFPTGSAWPWLLALAALALALGLAMRRRRPPGGRASSAVGGALDAGYQVGANRLRIWLRRLVGPVEALPPALATAIFGLGLAVNAGAAWPLGVMGLVAMAWIAVARPAIVLASLTASLPFYYALRLHLGPRPVAIVELLLALLIGARLARTWLADSAGAAGDPLDPRRGALPEDGRRATARRWISDLQRRLETRLGRLHPLDLAVLLVVAWSALTPLWATHPQPARYEWRTVILEPALLYAVLRAGRDRRQAAQTALDGLVFGAVLAAAWGLFGSLATLAPVATPWASGVLAEGVIRARGPYGSPNNLALWLGRALALCLGMIAASRGRRRRLGLAAGLIITTGLWATFSRGAAIFGLPALLLFLALVLRPRLGRRSLIAGLLGLVAAALAILPFAATQRVRGTFDPSPGSTAYYRLRLWQSAGRMIRDQPWLGVGLDNFLYAYRDFYVQRDVVQERGLSHPHNLVLDTWTRLGLPGLVLGVWILLGNLQAGRRALAATADGAWRAMAIGALGMQVYALAHGLIDNSVFLVDLASAGWIAQAALLALSEPERRG